MKGPLLTLQVAAFRWHWVNGVFLLQQKSWHWNESKQYISGFLFDLWSVWTPFATDLQRLLTIWPYDHLVGNSYVAIVDAEHEQMLFHMILQKHVVFRRHLDVPVAGPSILRGAFLLYDPMFFWVWKPVAGVYAKMFLLQDVHKVKSRKVGLVDVQRKRLNIRQSYSNMTLFW